MGNRTQQKQCEGKPTISGPNVYSISSWFSSRQYNSTNRLKLFVSTLHRLNPPFRYQT
uniref:Uncharacterized protein n=1 Tax=Tetranychus urticae TaxID=32264 RepID=T1K5P3_TETUR